MKISLNQIINHPLGKFKIIWEMLDNTKIFNRTEESWNDNIHNANVYIWEDLDIKESNNLPYNLNILLMHKILYIGRQSCFNSNALLTNRCVSHNKDLLSVYINQHKNCICHIISCGMTINESKCLEANLINSLNKKLSKRKEMNILKKDHIINKRKEKKWEILANKYLR